MSTSLRTEFYKYRVPLSQVWDGVTDTLAASVDSVEVESLVMRRLEEVNNQIQDPDTSYSLESDAESVELARSRALASVQSKFSGTIPALPDRETDILTQHYLICSLIGKLLQKGGESLRFREWLLLHTLRVIRSDTLPNWRGRSKDLLNALICVKGFVVCEEILSRCEILLSEKDLALPCITILTKKSNRFKQIMSSPDMVQDGDKTLPKLLTKLTLDKEFRQVFVWLPLDGSTMPSNPEHYRHVLSLIVRILFGKLSQRGGGIDKRSSFAERQNAIMAYIGSVPKASMDLVFSIFLDRIRSTDAWISPTDISWTSSNEFAAQGAIFFDKKSLQNQKLCLGLLSVMEKMVSQMRRNIDFFVPTLAALVVQTLFSVDAEVGWGRQIVKLCICRLKEMMSVYSSLPCWTPTLLEPVFPILQAHLSRSSSAELSTVFRMVTSWAHHEHMLPLFTHFAPTLFVPRAYTGRPCDVLLETVLTLCGEEVEQKGQKGVKKLHKKRRFNDDSEDEEDAEMETENCLVLSVGKQIVADNFSSILEIISLSLKGTKKIDLHLQVILVITNNLGSASVHSGDLLALLAEMVGPLTRRRKWKQCVALFGAMHGIASKLDKSVAVAPGVSLELSRAVLLVDDVLARSVLAEAICALGSPAQVLLALNSVKKSSVQVQPDVDRHIDVLQALVEEEVHFESQDVLLIRHCLYLLGTFECDSTIRHLAERFLCQQRICPDGTPGLLLMILNSVHRLLESAELSPFRSGIKILMFFVRTHAPQMEDDNARLFHKDVLPFVETLQDLLHLQKQKRSRAFKKLVDQADSLSMYTRQKIFVPIGLEMIGQTDTAKAHYDQGMCDVGIAAICASPNPIQIAINLIKTLLRKNPEREKFVFKAVGKVAEFVRLRSESVTADEVRAVQQMLVPQLKRRVWDAKDEGMVKLDVVVALLEVLKLLPSAEFDAAMPQIVSLICRGLPSREILCRKAARESLRRCAPIIGAGKIAWLLKQIRLALPKGGYQAAVAVYTAHAVLEALLGVNFEAKNSAEIAEEILEFLRIEDRQWAALQTRSANDLGEEATLTKQCLEAGRMRGHEIAELGGKILAPEIVTCVLLRSVYGFFASLEIDLEIDSDDAPEEKTEEMVVTSNKRKKFAHKQESSSSSEDESKPTKRRIEKKYSKKDDQLNSCYGKKFFTRIEGALNALVSGLIENPQFTPDMKLGVVMQSFAVFNDFLSRKAASEFETDLFASTHIPAKVLEIDHLELGDEDQQVKVTKKSRAELLRESTYLVQPGASTGKGHWVTEEWKKGKVAVSTPESKFLVRTCKVKLLGNIALRLLNMKETAMVESVTQKILAKFLTRSLCSGISELFQLSAKTIARTDLKFFNEKGLSQILKKLISTFQQMHSSGSDLSFITMKSQGKIQAGELAATCASLLLALTAEASWLKPDMLEALASHVLASLDNSALQWSSLLILRKVLLPRKSFANKSPTVYACLNKVGELVSTASSEKVAAASGTLYGKFLVEYAHTDKSLVNKISLLLKQGQGGSVLSRKTALNTIYAFVRALTGRQVQDQFGELIVVTLSVRISSEEDSDARDMICEIVKLCLEKFPDPQRRSQVCDTIAHWADSMTKWQFVYSSMEICCRVFAHETNWCAKCPEIVDAVIRQLPFIADQGADVAVRGSISVIQCIESLSKTEFNIEKIAHLAEYVTSTVLTDRAADPLVTREAIRFVFSLSVRPQTALKLEKDIWPLMMRVLHVLCSDVVESHLDLASLSMKSIANLLPITSSVEEVTPEVVMTEASSVEDADLGLFGREKKSALDEEVVSWTGKGELERLNALLKKIRYEVRKLMGRSRESVIRLASLLKLSAALILGCLPTTEFDILPLTLEILIRLATINKSAEEVSIELDKKKIDSLFDLSILRPIEQIGYLSKMSNTALESIERHYSPLAGYFTKQLTLVTTTINSDRKTRKISLMNLAISNPQRMAMLRLQKSKKKSVKTQANKKVSIKRIKGLIH